MNENLLTELLDLLGPRLYQLIINPKTQRPLLMSSLKRKTRYTHMSGGEKVLVHLAYDLYNGSGKLNLTNLYFLDDPSRQRALQAINNFVMRNRP